MDFQYIVEILPYILQGLKTTVQVFGFTLLLSIPLGILIGSVQSIKMPFINQGLSAYTWLFRGTPLLLQLYFGMYGLPAFGFTFNRITVAILIFTLNYGAYFTEIIRGSILSISKGQTEVSLSLGFTKSQTFFYVIIPQALKRSLQSITNEIITLVKDTSLIAAIALNDLLRNAKEVVSRDFRVEAFFVVGAIYLIFTLLIVDGAKKVEKKYAFYR